MTACHPLPRARCGYPRKPYGAGDRTSQYASWQSFGMLTMFHQAALCLRPLVRRDSSTTNLGALLLADGDTEQAVTLLERALERNPSSLQTRTQPGVDYSAASLLEDAREQLHGAVLSEPSNADAHYQLRLVLMKLGLSEAARKRLELSERLPEQ